MAAAAGFRFAVVVVVVVRMRMIVSPVRRVEPSDRR